MYLDRLGDNASLQLIAEPTPTAILVVRHLRNLADRLEVEAGFANRAVPAATRGAGAERQDYLLKIREVIGERADRRKIFGNSFVDDPAWAIMLDLFEAHHLQRSRSIKSACLASGVPATTALRHLAMMEDIGLIERRQDQRDKRRILIVLTEQGLRKLYRYFDGL